MEAQRMTGNREQELSPLWWQRWLCIRQARGEAAKIEAERWQQNLS